MALWPLCEARNVQVFQATSAVNADNVAVGVPGPGRGKVWIVTGCGYRPDTAETQTISFTKVTTLYPSGAEYSTMALLNPVSLALNPARATFVEQGMEFILFPGEYIYVLRGNHTAGSSMHVWLQVIEIDLPLYTYDEPQIVKRADRALSTLRQSIAGRASTVPSARESGAREGRGGKGIPEGV